MQTIYTIAELDEKIADCDRAAQTSDEALRATLGSFRMEMPADFPPDPFDPAYRAAQMDLYRKVTGQTYAPAFELTKFDVGSAVARPFPIYTNSTSIAGDYFMAIGFLLRSMALPPKSQVLEFGAGWGWTSILLAQLGHHVTVVDIEENFCDLIMRRAQKEGVEIEVINGEFFSVEAMDRQFDAVLFYDSFHHCDDHLRLLQSLHRVLTPEGRIFFGAEPIENGFSFPWGLRMDGWSLWGVRKNGWMELGFRDDYFAAALKRTGWFGRRIGVQGESRLRVWEARQLSGARFRFEAKDSQIHSEVGRLVDDRIVVKAAVKGTAVYGPYTSLPAGDYLARIGFRSGTPRKGAAEMDVSIDLGKRKLATRMLSERDPAEIRFSLDADADGLEVRLLAKRGFAAEIEFVEFVPV